MLSHEEIWTAIDALAARHRLSVSGLARRAGLDPTSFNKSKRYGADGRLRWPSTESIAKVLEATGETVTAFFSPGAVPDAAAALPQEGSARTMTLPLSAFPRARGDDLFDADGRPAGPGWDILAFPAAAQRPDSLFALEVEGEALLPAYGDGTVLVLEAGATLRRGDRLVLSTRNGTLAAGTLNRQSPRGLELTAFGEDGPQAVAEETIAWTARILWASQ